MPTGMTPFVTRANLSQVVGGPLSVANGGTGATTAAGARANLGITAAGPATATAGEVLVPGNVIRLSAAGGGTAGYAYKAGATTGSFDFIGIVTAGGGIGDEIEYVLSGPSVSVLFASAPDTVDNGKEVWLSATSGYATLTIPTSGAIVSLGFLAGADGSDPTPAIQFTPQPRYTLP
jgi:hypothetical protein